MIQYLTCLFTLILGLVAQGESVFPSLEKAKSYSGELVFVDHVNRRGSMRLQVEDHYQ